MTGIDYIISLGKFRINLEFLTCAAHGYNVTDSEENVEIFYLKISRLNVFKSG